MKWGHQTRALAKSLGAELKAHREMRGMTQENLAKIIGMTRVSVCNLERGIHAPTIDTFVIICDALGVHADIMLRHAIETRTTPPSKKRIPKLFRGRK